MCYSTIVNFNAFLYKIQTVNSTQKEQTCWQFNNTKIYYSKKVKIYKNYISSKMSHASNECMKIRTLINQMYTQIAKHLNSQYNLTKNGQHMYQWHHYTQSFLLATLRQFNQGC